ncbi:hypothetical protein N7513_001796 [Penicillium frequentans]|nr:hypothetical protein N7513_001796 [Penicillium glabrum]
MQHSGECYPPFSAFPSAGRPAFVKEISCGGFDEGLEKQLHAALKVGNIFAKTRKHAFLVGTTIK